MLPAVSAEDCLFAELNLDPAEAGCRSYEATDFLIYRRPLDPTSSLILWQIGAIGEFGYKYDSSAWNPEGLVVLTEKLLEVYRRDHEVIVYEAALLPVCASTIARIALENLPSAPVTIMSTLCVPAMSKPVLDAAIVARLMP
jgi:hypothetical protein